MVSFEFLSHPLMIVTPTLIDFSYQFLYLHYFDFFFFMFSIFVKFVDFPWLIVLVDKGEEVRKALLLWLVL